MPEPSPQLTALGGPNTTLASRLRGALLLLVGLALALWASAPWALAAGILFAVLAGAPAPRFAVTATRWMLQASVVLLGFSMDLPTVLRLGLHGSLFAAVSISVTLALGFWLGKVFGLAERTSALLSAGTAICGGSAIAALSTVIGATEAEIAVSMGTVFLLNAVALYLFPPIGTLLRMSQGQFGLWAGVAIHDISSVVGAGLSYGPQSLATATAVKLSRTLWILPITFAFSMREKRRSPSGDQSRGPRAAAPWFIGLFLAASLVRSWSPQVASLSPLLSEVAHRGMVWVLFMVGSALSLSALKSVGWRTVAVGSILWFFISAASLGAILAFP